MLLLSDLGTNVTVNVSNKRFWEISSNCYVPKQFKQHWDGLVSQHLDEFTCETIYAWWFFLWGHFLVNCVYFFYGNVCLHFLSLVIFNILYFPRKSSVSSSFSNLYKFIHRIIQSIVFFPTIYSISIAIGTFCHFLFCICMLFPLLWLKQSTMCLFWFF